MSHRICVNGNSSPPVISDRVARRGSEYVRETSGRIWLAPLRIGKSSKCVA
jgi:hypothetical protein